MSRDVESLEKNFKGTKEEFWAGRRKALEDAQARKEKNEAECKAAEQKELNDLVAKGYTPSEAKGKISAAKIKAAESAGLGKSKRIGFSRG